MDQDVLLKAYKAAQENEQYCLLTVVETTLKGTPRKSGAKMIVLENGRTYGTIGGGRNEKAAIEEALKAIKSKKPQLKTYDYFGEKGQSVCGGQMKVFMEPYAIQDHLIICGGGHIGLPLSVLAKMLNFKVSIVDNRRIYAGKKRFPHVDKRYCGDYAKILKKMPLEENTYVMIVTQGNEHDYACLETVLRSKATYIGCISSKAKKLKFSRRLENSGFKKGEIARVSIQAGFDIGAQTPEEIAVSIAAEMVTIRQKEERHSQKFKMKGSLK